MVAIDIVERGD